MGGQSAIKNPRRIFSQLGGDATLPSRVTNLENNEYKITYYEVVSGASGSVTIPTGATINAGEFGLSGNCVLSKIDGSNKPTFESPKTAGGVVVTSSLNVSNGAWVASGVYTDASVALIYSIKIKAINYGNLTYDNIIETVELTDLTGYVKKGTLTTNTIPKATSSDTIGDSSMNEDATYLYVPRIIATNAVQSISGGAVFYAYTSGGFSVYVNGGETAFFDASGNFRVNGLTASQIVETDASKNLVSAAKGTAYNKNFGTGTANIAEIGSTLGNNKPVITSSSGKLQTSDWVDITSSCTINGWISFGINKIKAIDMGNYYIVNGQVVGTSNSSTTQVVLPFTNNGVQLDDCRFAINNGTNIFARCFVFAGSNTVDFRATAAGGVFSSAGTKAIYFTIVVEK